VNVVKAYTPDKPGDFGSGVVEMTTMQFRNQRVSSQPRHVVCHRVTGSSFRQYSGGLSRWGSAARSCRTPFRRSSSSANILNPNGFTQQELETIGEAFVGDWTGREISSADPATDIALTTGTTVGRLGLVFSGVSTRGYDEVDEIQRFFGFDVGDDLIAYNDYDLNSAKETASVGCRQPLLSPQ
jgi:hypothetical protein